MKRLGSVLVFKRGVSKKQAEVALRKIQDVLQEKSHIKYDEHDRPVRCSFVVNEFDERYGGPVWYIP